MLSRSNYVMIDGVPAEIHLNEPRQLMVSRVITHHVYEVIRESNNGKFNRAYYALPEVVRSSVNAVRDTLPEAELTAMLALEHKLVVSMMQSGNGSLNDKHDCLMDIHRTAHETFIGFATPEWQSAYSEAKSRYNSSLKIPKRPDADATIKVTERLKRG